ncbi:MAG TPA: hypothetical protein VMW27_13965 [Thermoanaerobaculia bacterium]|nr:hypothetical protein [Thermoanaerobaculia bacterium]
MARVWPALKFIVLAAGADASPGKRRACPLPGGATTVTLTETARAESGTPQVAAARAKLRATPEPSAGPPSGPFGLRVSTARQGVVVWKPSPAVWKRCAKIPGPSPSWPSLSQTATIRPAPPAATRGAHRAPAVAGWSRTSPPRGCRNRSKSCAKAAGPPAVSLSQTATKSPEPWLATAGRPWAPAVVALTAISAPSGLPEAAKRRARTPGPEASAPSQTATKLPELSSPTAGRDTGATAVSSRSSPVLGVPEAEKLRPKTPEPVPATPCDCQTTTASPEGPCATAGECCNPASVTLAVLSVPRRPPAAEKRCQRMSPPLCQATAKAPDASIETAGERWSPAVAVLTRKSGPSGVPETSKRRT